MVGLLAHFLVTEKRDSFTPRKSIDYNYKIIVANHELFTVMGRNSFCFHAKKKLRRCDKTIFDQDSQDLFHDQACFAKFPTAVVKVSLS